MERGVEKRASLPLQETSLGNTKQTDTVSNSQGGLGTRQTYSQAHNHSNQLALFPGLQSHAWQNPYVEWRQMGFGGVAYCVVHALALQFTGSGTLPNIHLTSFYVGVLPGLPPR